MKIFSGANVEKATLFQRLLSPHPHPSKIAVMVVGMIGQVSQNGMPFCTGCTLFGHILNLPEGLRPLGTPIELSENETPKCPLEVFPFHFRRAGECTYCSLVCISRRLPKHFVAMYFMAQIDHLEKCQDICF